MDYFVHLVVPGLSSPSSSSSASTSRPKDQSKSSGESEASTDPMTTRRAKHGKTDANKSWQASLAKPWFSTQKTRRTKGGIQTQGIPDWLQPFTADLEDLETHVPALSSEREISDSEGDASKVETQNGSTVSIFTSPKTEIATYA